MVEFGLSDIDAMHVRVDVIEAENSGSEDISRGSEAPSDGAWKYEPTGSGSRGKPAEFIERCNQLCTT